MDEDRDALGRSGDRAAAVSDAAPVAPPKAKRRISWRTALGGGLGIAVIVGTFVFVLPRVADYRDVWAVVKTLSWSQVGLLVVPVVMLLSLAFAHPIPLSFRWEELLGMAGASAFVAAVLADGRTRRFEGYALVAAYAAVVVGFLVAGDR